MVFQFKNSSVSSLIPVSATSRILTARRRANGFTLFEIIVVVFVIGVIVTFASLSVNQHSERYVEDEARRLHHLMRLANEEAILTAQELSLKLTGMGYTFERLEGPKWVPLAEDPMFRAREFPPTLVVKLKMNDQEIDLGDSEKPARIYIFSSGEVSPFLIEMNAEDSEQVYMVSGSLTGQIAYQAPQDSDEINS